MNARAQPPRLGEPAPLRLPPLHRVRLGNGIDVRIVERRELPVVDVQVIVRAGAAHDDPARAGRAFLTADLLDAGTTSRGAIRIAEEAELLGASLHTRASWDYSAAALHVLTPRFEPAVELLADVVLRPAFDSSEFERKQRERLHALAQERDDPRTLASQAFIDLLYGSRHPYGLPIGGVPETVQRLEVADVRDFYLSRFAPGNACIVVCGDVGVDDVVARLEHHFGVWRGTAVRDAPLCAPPAAQPAIHIVDLPGSSQSELRVGHTGPPRGTDDYIPLHVANTVLGGAFTSRLNILLRQEKGYTYGAGSSFAFRREGGPFLASTAVAVAATADAVRDMVRETARLAREPVGADELARAKRYLILGLPRNFETTSDVAEHVSELALYDLPDDYYEQYSERVSRVTPGEVLAAAQRWLRPDELTIVVAGDAAATADELRDLGMGAVHVRNDT